VSARQRLCGPVVDECCEAAIDRAIEELVAARSPGCHADSGAVLDVLASLALKITAALPDVVADARDQGYTWAEIAALLGATKPAVKRRYAARAKDWRPPLELD
jgi:hypothetical protein